MFLWYQKGSFKNDMFCRDGGNCDIVACNNMYCKNMIHLSESAQDYGKIEKLGSNSISQKRKCFRKLLKILLPKIDGISCRQELLKVLEKRFKPEDENFRKVFNKSLNKKQPTRVGKLFF